MSAAHVWLLYLVLAFPTHRIYMRAYTDQADCERTARVMNTLADTHYDWICFERRVAQ